MSARVAPASFHPFIFYCLTFLRFWRFRLFLLAFSFFPLDERVGKTANGTATGASTAILVVVRLGNETHANAGAVYIVFVFIVNVSILKFTC